jgi:hypothetical protein
MHLTPGEQYSVVLTVEHHHLDIVGDGFGKQFQRVGRAVRENQVVVGPAADEPADRRA